MVYCTSTIYLTSGLEQVGDQYNAPAFYLQESDIVPFVLENQWATETKRCTSTLYLTSALE